MGIAAVGVVYGVYQMSIGSIAEAHATDSNHPVLESSRKKAGFTALAFVGALTILTKDANVGIFGGGMIIAMELSYRHGIMSDPASRRLQNPSPATAYMPAETAIPFHAQGETG